MRRIIRQKNGKKRNKSPPKKPPTKAPPKSPGKEKAPYKQRSYNNKKENKGKIENETPSTPTTRMSLRSRDKNKLGNNNNDNNPQKSNQVTVPPRKGIQGFHDAMGMTFLSQGNQYKGGNLVDTDKESKTTKPKQGKKGGKNKNKNEQVKSSTDVEPDFVSSVARLPDPISSMEEEVLPESTESMTKIFHGKITPFCSG